MGNILLQLNNVSKKYLLGKANIVNALNNIDLSIRQGEFLAIVGPSGSGKSTLLNLLGCLDKPSEGKIIFDNEDIMIKKHHELAQIRNKKIGFVFQNFNLIPILNVYENIEFPFLVSKNNFSAQERREIILEIIEQINLSSTIKHKSNELSGGQMQRVAIGRSLVLSPLMILADEPTANLESVTSEKILTLMQEINKKKNTTFIFATHDPLVLKFMTRIITIKDGRIVKDETNI